MTQTAQSHPSISVQKLAQSQSPRLVGAANASMGELGRGSCAFVVGGAALGSPDPKNRLYGPFEVPADLLEFLTSRSTRDAAHELHIAKGTVHRLRNGYWPDDPRKIMRAWAAYKGRMGEVSSSWFLRRVHPGGAIQHAGRVYTAVQLAGRTGELVAAARSADGDLLAQTLTMPPERFTLVKMGGDQ